MLIITYMSEKWVTECYNIKKGEDMQITKLEHSGMIVEKDGKKLVFDPVEFAETLPELHDVAAVIITHIHADHLQTEKINGILDLNPNAKVIAPEDAAEVLPNAILVAGGDEMDVEGFDLRFFGKDHASVLAGKVPCDNIGVVMDDKLTNPGDSFDLLDLNGAVEVLLVPEVAPWTKISETIEFMKIAKPKVVIPVHDGLLSKMGKGVYDNLLRGACTEIGAEFAPLGVGESMDI